MNTIARKLRSRRDTRRAGRAAHVTSSSMQRELLVAATRQNIVR